ncbi:hypothetical protein OAM96_03440 [Candidatus Poseidoniaceae archaeon]|nr:hypothetical protein [Candidatus Poseidoniaceae archaeon]
MKLLRKLFPRKDVITASMAAVPWREDILEQVVESLLPQVDRLNIYLNEWNQIPEFLNHSKINAVMSQKEIGDLGARGKFYWCQNIRGYHLTVDDDILYPPDYVEQILFNLGRYPNAVVSYHGSILNYPVFKKRNNKLTHFVRDSPKDMKVTLIGTGVLAYDANKLAISFSKFKSNNWADGWFSLQVRNANFRCITIRHKKDWLKPLPTEGPDIWSMNREESRDQQINQWINEYKLWDEMTLFSERIRDRSLRWWVHRDEVQNKNVGGKISGQDFAKSLGIRVPAIYNVVSSPEEIPTFEKLGESFVIKPARGYSATNVFLMNNGVNLFDGKTWNRQEVIDEFSISKQSQSDSNKKIIIEELLIPWDGEKRIPYDYKFYMFGEKIAYCQIIDRRSSANTKLNKTWYVDSEFNIINKQIMVEYWLDDKQPAIMKPDCWNDLVSTAKVLGAAVNRFTRVDLYATNNGPVFGEFTPTPHGGRGFTKWADKWLGEMWEGVEGAGD